MMKAKKSVEILDLNAWKSEHEGMKFWWTHEVLDMSAQMSEHERTQSLVNVRKSEYEPMRVWQWTHEFLDKKAQKSEGTKIWWTREYLDMKAEKCGERTKVCTWTHENLMNAQNLDMTAWRSEHERTKVWLTRKK